MKNKTNPIISTLPNGIAELDRLCIGGGSFIMEEIWRPIIGYKGYYEVSSHGLVKRVGKVATNIDSRGITYNKVFKEKILKQCASKRGGYLQVKLCINGKATTKIVHRLVARAFLNHSPCGHVIVIDHINNIKTDNNVDNLQLITNRENCSKDRKNGTSKYIGVSLIKKTKKWRASMYINGILKHLGNFDTEKQASNAYNNKFIKMNYGH